MEGSFLVCDLVLERGCKVRQIELRSMEMALAMRSKTEPLIYPIPSKGIVRIEFMMSEFPDVSFNDVANSSEFIRSKAVLPIAFGKTRRGENVIADLAEMPHLLVSGTTGSGKSIALHSIINSLFSRTNIELALIDPKKVEFSCYDGVDCLYKPIAKDIDTSKELLRSLISEMDSRFDILQGNKCRDISRYRGSMSYIVVIIDELADLMMSSKKEFQTLICRLAQKSRACGIHLIVSTQRPSTDVITGLIKANFPSRLSCRVSSAVNSRVILDRNGAERLSGKGDSIIVCPEHSFVRFKGSFISDEQISNFASKRRKSLWRTLWRSS
jgi:S-DNA-T family DNA segregation ATPase FtsK/SpoIIIE